MEKEKKFNNKVRIVARIMGVVLIFALIAGLIYGLTIPNKINDGNISLETEGGTVLNVSNNGVNLVVARIAEEDFEEEDVSPEAESAYTLTATVSPSNLQNKKVLWEIYFDNPESEWATGKDVKDYVKFTELDENSAKLECCLPFGEQIKVKAISDQDYSKFAICTVDYKEKLLGYTITLDRITYDPELFSYEYDDGRRIHECRVFLDYELEKSAAYSFNLITSEAYTLPLESVTFYCELTAKEDFKQLVNEAGFSTENLIEFSFDATDGLTGELKNFFDFVWCDTLNESDITSAGKNELIYFLHDRIYPTYELKIYDYKGGNEITSFDIVFDTATIIDQVVVDGVEMNSDSIVF